MDDLGGSYRFTRISSHVSVRYRFALVKVRRPSDSLILLVACPLLPFTCPFTALCCPFTALYCPLLPFTCPILPFIHQNGQWVTKRTSGYRLGYRLGIDYGIDCLITYHPENYGIHAAAALTSHNR